MKLHSLWLFGLFHCVAGMGSIAGAQSTNEAKKNTDSPKLWENFQTKLSLQTNLQYDTRSSDQLSPSYAPGHWPKRLHSNTYLLGTIYNPYLSLQLRVEHLSRPLIGFEENWGWGLSHLNLTAHIGQHELSLGDIYDQFGSGQLFRTYEDRNLGIDNALRGLKWSYTSAKGIRLKVLGGQHRNYFDRGHRLWNDQRGWLYGADIELPLTELLSPSIKTYQLNWGVSYVGKVEESDDILRTSMGQTYRLIQPRHVPAWATRLEWNNRHWSVNAEYAYKYADPMRTNDYHFRTGQMAMLTASYSHSGWTAFVGTRKSTGFDWRSDRAASGNALRINQLLPFAPERTYTLAAQHPYTTQAEDEWAWQGELRYSAKRGSTLGGKYGTDLRLSGAWIAEGYFHDIGLEIKKKLSRSLELTLSYFNQHYNAQVLEGHTDYTNIRGVNNTSDDGIIYSNIWVTEMRYRLSRSLILRGELQYLHTKQYKGDWLYGLLELSIAPRWMISLSDEWNIGHKDKSQDPHYYMLSVVYNQSGSRLQLGYGRTSANINCSGGVCRLMPETQGLYLNYNLSI